MCKYCEEEKIRKFKFQKTSPETYVGNKYNRLTVVDCYWIEEKSGRKRMYFDCKCDCGNVTTASRDHVVLNRIKSCGCLISELTSNRNTKHGLYKKYKRVFDVWNNMIERCENPNNSNYKNYGGRGIKVCGEWHELKTFVEWAYKNGYEERDKNNRRNVLSIERIDVNGNYEPSNCKWIPCCEQGKNKRYSGRQKLCVDEG